MNNEIYVEEYNADQKCFHRHTFFEACQKNLNNLKDGNFSNNWTIFAYGTAEECNQARINLLEIWGEEKRRERLNPDLLF